MLLLWDKNNSRIRMQVMTSARMIYKRLLIQALHLSILKTEARVAARSSKWWDNNRKLSKVLIKWVQNNSTWIQVLKKLVTFHLPSNSHRRKRKKRRKRRPLPPQNSRCRPAIYKTTSKTMAWANSTKLKTKVNALASLKNKSANWLKFKKNSVFLLSRKKNLCNKSSSSKDECKKNSNVKRKRKLKLKLV